MSTQQAKEIMVIEQLPIITERFKSLSDEVKATTDAALAMECTEETVKQVKATRAELNKAFAEFEAKRKDIKRKIMEPYDKFEASYTEFLSSIYTDADKRLKGKIDTVEADLKQDKASEVKRYMTEYAESKGLGEYVGRGFATINITLTASKKSLKEQAAAYIDRVASDIALMQTQDHADEIMVEYKQCYDASKAITTIVQRHKAIAEQEERRATMEAQRMAREEAAAKVAAVAPPAVVAPPVVAPPSECVLPPDETEHEPAAAIHRYTFTVQCTAAQAAEIRPLLTERGIHIE